MLALGIDVSKAKLHVALLTAGDKVRHKTCTNTPAGFEDLRAWLHRQGADQVHACLEATGSYGDAAALYLADAGHVVSVVNPAAIHAYARAQQLRVKTDRTDAALIARYCAREQPAAWTPPPVELRHLQVLVRRLDALLGMHTQEVNRLQVATDPVLQASIRAVRDTLAAQIADLKARIAAHIDQHPGLRAQRDLLETIPGIGASTAAVLLAELFCRAFTSARQAAAFAGLTPRLRESGQWRGQARLSRCGPARLRKALYLPALSALRFNPAITALRQRLRDRGKPPMVIVGAAMRHLVHLAFGVLKSGRPYDAQYKRA
ncbi:MAG: IS110 family transposase [Vicinamibacterales bacterium]